MPFPWVWGVSGTAVVCGLMPFGFLCHQPLQALLFILPHSQTGVRDQWPAGTWRGLAPCVLQGSSWEALRSSAAHSTPHYQASLLFSALNYNFLPWRFTPLGPHERWGMFGVTFEMLDPPAVPKLHRLCSPTSSGPVWFPLCQWWRLIEHQEGKRTFHKTAGGKGLPIIFLLMTFRMHRFLLAVPLVSCP